MEAINSKEGKFIINGHPDKCPFCHKSIMPNFIFSHYGKNFLEVFLSCPDKSCKMAFIAYYRKESNGSYYNFSGSVTQGTFEDEKFPSSIEEISNKFAVIYNQAFAAEFKDLKEICGAGYRKALEFLIKDYLVFNHPNDKEIIEKKLLGPCISDHVSDNKIKEIAKRAVWIGNDETHYIRKW